MLTRRILTLVILFTSLIGVSASAVDAAASEPVVNPSESVRSERFILKLGEQSDLALARKDRRRHKKLLEQIIEEFAARGLQPASPAAYVAAKAQFQTLEERFVKYKELRVKTSNLEKSRATIEKKKAMLQELQGRYTKLADYQSFEWLVAAVYRTADLYAEFAKTIYTLPEPKGLTPAELDSYISQLEDLGLQFENVAIEWYEKAVLESRRLKVSNEWSRRALVAIHKFKPMDYPLPKDEQ